MNEHQSALWEPWSREVAPSNDGSLIINGEGGSEVEEEMEK